MKKNLSVIPIGVLLLLSCTACSAGSTEEASGTGAVEAGTGAAIKSIEVSSHSEADESTAAQEVVTYSVPETKAPSLSEESSDTDDNSDTEDDSDTEDNKDEYSQEESNVEDSEVSVPESSETDLCSITLSDNELELYVGEQYQLEVYMEPYYADRTDYRWTWSNNSVIFVESSGNIIAKSAGSATITAETYNGLTAVCEVRVVERNHETSAEISELSQPEAKPEPEYKPAPEITGKRVDTSWFDDAVFVGDSISVGLYNYADDGALGDADFLAKECMGYHSAMWDIDYEYAIHPTYNGVEVRIEDAIQDIGKKKIFILLGMNDICSWGVEESVEAMKDFTDMILEKNPDVQIYIQSATPMVGGKVREDYLNNENIREYNELIKPICEERGFVYLDIASVLSDEYGNLRDDYCSDINGAGFHFNRAGDDAWVEYLKTHVE